MFDRDVGDAAVTAGQTHEPRGPAVTESAGRADGIPVAVLDDPEHVHSCQAEPAVDCVTAGTFGVCRGFAFAAFRGLPVPDAVSDCAEQCDLDEVVEQRLDRQSPMQAPA